MAELKTRPNDGDVDAFLDNVEDPAKREDCNFLLRYMQDLTGCQPKMWGPSIIGFDSYHYKYDSGREGDWFICGFSPRKQNLTVYIMSGFERYDDLMSRLGKFKTGKSCLYIKRLSDIDTDVMEELISGSYRYMKQKYGNSES